MQNIQDPAVAEKIRRGPHEYVLIDGKMQYVTKEYKHKEYPKIMDRTPPPKFSEFKGKADAQSLLDEAMRDWNAEQMASTVHSKAEEDAWLKEHAPEPERVPTPVAPAQRRIRTAV